MDSSRKASREDNENTLQHKSRQETLLRAAKKGATFTARGGQISGCAMGCGMRRIAVGAGKV